MFARTFPRDVLNTMKFDPEKVEVLVCPSSLHLLTVQSFARSKINVGAQNISLTGNGAYTGEISLEMLDDIKVRWTLAGHSERRTLYKETDSEVGLKTK